MYYDAYAMIILTDGSSRFDSLFEVITCFA